MPSCQGIFNTYANVYGLLTAGLFFAYLLTIFTGMWILSFPDHLYRPLHLLKFYDNEESMDAVFGF